MADEKDPHYNFRFNGVELDPYRILMIYEITHPAQQHAIKKLLRAGRSNKSTKQDVQEVIRTLERWLAMMDEAGAPAPAPGLTPRPWLQPHFDPAHCPACFDGGAVHVPFCPVPNPR